MGRPVEYNESYVSKAQEYLDSCEDVNEQLVRQSNSEKGYEMYENRMKVELPSIEGLAVFLGVHRSTIYDWKAKYDEFSDIIEKLQAEQARRLLNNGLSGTYNPTIAKVLLTKHGYVDRQELTGKDGKDLLPTPLLDNVRNNDSTSQDTGSKQEN